MLAAPCEKPLEPERSENMSRTYRPPMSKASMMLEFRTIMQDAENKIQGVMHDSIDDFKKTVSEHVKSDV
jgi:hypothetical protein